MLVKWGYIEPDTPIFLDVTEIAKCPYILPYFSLKIPLLQCRFPVVVIIINC